MYTFRDLSYNYITSIVTSAFSSSLNLLTLYADLLRIVCAYHDAVFTSYIFMSRLSKITVYLADNKHFSNLAHNSLTIIPSNAFSNLGWPLTELYEHIMSASWQISFIDVLGSIFFYYWSQVELNIWFLYVNLKIIHSFSILDNNYISSLSTSSFSPTILTGLLTLYVFLYLNKGIIRFLRK